MKLMRLLDRLFRLFGDRGPGFEPEVGVRVPKVFSPGGRGAAGGCSRARARRLRGRSEPVRQVGWVLSDVEEGQMHG